MQRSLPFLILIVALVLLAGCTQPRPPAIPQPDAPQAPATLSPAAVETPSAPPRATTAAPVAAVTVVRYVENEKAWKDSNLRFAFRAPESWAVTTRQADLPEGSQGLEFTTTLVSDDIFTITTFPISRNQDQDYRNRFRQWKPAPAESTVTIGNIVFDRFESAGSGKTQVGYVGRKSSANDLGYSSVISFIADDARPFEKEDFENVVQTFSYLNKQSVLTATGEEIPRVR